MVGKTTKNYHQVAIACQARKCSQQNWPIWEGRSGLCVKHSLLIVTTSLFSGRQYLWHQLNPNTTKQKLKSFNEIFNLLMNAHDSSSCHWCVESNIFTHWECHHLNDAIDFEFWQGFFNPGWFQIAWGGIAEHIINSMLSSPVLHPN